MATKDDDILSKTAETQKFKQQSLRREIELQRAYHLLSSLCGSVLDKIIAQDEYCNLKERYTHQAKSLGKQIEALQTSISQIMQRKDEMHTWISEFLKHENLATIERSVIVTFIDNILIFGSCLTEHEEEQISH